jgi:2-phosphosulfolactate phosphatase
VNDPHGQQQYQVRFDWGSEGADAVSAGADVIVVVDILSFSTAVDIAVVLGLEVVPCAPADAVEASRRHGARLAEARGDGLSLSPASITAEAVAGLSRITLPSPNGSRIAAAYGGSGTVVVAGSLRNAAAIARWATAMQGERGDRFTIAVIAAGEARADGTTRFALEDLLGAGAIVEALAVVGIDYYSPEAAAAAAAFTGLRSATAQLIRSSASGRELVERGFAADVDLAVEMDVSHAVPILREFSFSS